MHGESILEWVDELKKQPSSMKEMGVKKLRKLANMAFMQKNFSETLFLTAMAKSLCVPCEGIDQLRGVTFLQMGSLLESAEALKEELRWFPQNAHAQEMLQLVLKHIGTPQITLNDSEFHALYPRIRPYTMVGIQRLQTLFANAKDICTQGLLGNFVECGVAGGGTSGLLAAVLQQHDTTGRKLFACDSYSGMPPSDENDVHAGKQAEESNWGTGTCAAPESSVISLCEKLSAQERLVIVKGYFCDTLPQWKEQMGPIAFLHMDGDWYSSTRDILIHLYDQLVPGAYVQIDDYGHWDGCRKAVHEFEQERGVQFNLHKCDGAGVWFKKA